MTKHTEAIPFLGIVELDDDDEPEQVKDRDMYYSKTQQDIADELGVSRIAVGLTEKRAVKKFRKVFLSKFKKDDFI
jgi:DNA-directed RNA polymerase specialized sigma subunit